MLQTFIDKQKDCEVSIVCQLPHAVNTVIYIANKEGIALSPMKLQKLMYFIYQEYYKQNGVPPFPERFEPWEYGPVLSDVYFAFKNRRDKHIKSYMIDAEGQYLMVDLMAHPKFCEALKTAWKKYKNFTGIELSELTHQQSGAWWKAVFDGIPYLRDEDIGKEEIDVSVLNK